MIHRKKLDPSFSASTAPEQLFQNSQRIEQVEYQIDM